MNTSINKEIMGHTKSQSVDIKKSFNITKPEYFKYKKVKPKIPTNQKLNNTALTFNLSKTRNFGKTTTNDKLNNTNNNNFNISSNTTNTFKKNNSIFQLSEFHKKYQLENPNIPFDDYVRSTRDIMNEYRYDSKADNPINTSEKKLFVEDLNYAKFKKDMNKISISNSNQLEPLKLESKMKILINNEEYNSPIRSFGVIWKNKIIHENVVKNNYIRQKNQYDDFICKISEVEKSSKQLYKRMKVTNVIENKNEDTASINNILDNIAPTQSAIPTTLNLLSPNNKSN